jgi:hypothetical protein
MPSYIPSYARDKVLVGLARLFIGPYNATSPLLAPANSVPLNGAWPVGWVPIGATEEGVTFNFQRSTEAVRIEEQATPVYKNTSEIDWNIEAVLSQDSLDTMKLAMGGGTIVVTPPGSGTVGTRKLTISTDMDQLCLGMEGQNEFGFWRRFRVPLITSEGNVGAKFRRAADARRYACKFNALCAPEEVDIIEMNAAALP